MKFFGLSILFWSCTKLLCAQTVTWTEPLKVSRDLADVRVVGSDESGFFVVEEVKKDRSIKLVRYSTVDMKPQWTQSIPVASGTNEHQFESVLQLDDRFFFFTSGFSKESEQFQIYCTMLDAKGTKMGDAALVHYTLSESRELSPRFGYSVSPDKSKILLYFDPPFERKTTDALSFKLYDLSLDLLMEKELLLPYTPEIVQVHNFIVDDNGNIYLMSGRNPEKSGTNFQRSQGGRYVIYFYSYLENKLKEYDVSLKEKQVVSVVFDFNKTQDVVIAGYYSNDSKFAVTGTFLFVVTTNGGAVKAASFMPFTKEFLSKFKRETEPGQEIALTDFYLDHLIMQADGTMILLGEQYYSNEKIAIDPVTGRQTVEFRYNYDDLIATKLESNGRQSWNVKIPKRQYVTSNQQVCSYTYFQDTSGIHLFFNDNGENLQKLVALPEAEATGWAGSNNSITTAVKLANNGSFTRETLLNNKEMGVQLQPSLSSRAANGPKVLGYEDARTYKFCVVK